MSPLVRCGLVAAVIVGAFAGGYFLKARPDLVTAAPEPAGGKVAAGPAATLPATARPARVTPTAESVQTVKAIATQPTTPDELRRELDPPALPPPGPRQKPESELPNLPPQADRTPPHPPLPPEDSPVKLADPRPVSDVPILGLDPPPPAPPPAEKINLDEPGVQMVRKELGHQTTVLDKSAPVPAVLADARRASLRTTGGNSEPEPTGGPMPRLGPAPVASDPAATRTVRLVNDRCVALDFEVTRSGSSKVTAVDLWTTRDGGTTWQKTDRMDGCKPPFRTRLGSEGAYGFKLAFESASGMRTPDPQPGQAPDLDLTLDTTPPAVTLYPPRAGDRPGQVHIPWVMADIHLDAVSARLEYSPDGKEWLPVEGGPARMTESGYGLDWTPPADVPPHVLLRVTVKDKAGNATTVASADRVAIDLVVPEGRVTGLHDEARQPERGPMPRAVGESRTAVPAQAMQLVRAVLFDPSGLELAHYLQDARRLQILREAHRRWTDGMIEMRRTVPRFRSPAEWAENVTGTEVIVQETVPSVCRRDPFEAPAVGPELSPLPDAIVDYELSSRGWRAFIIGHTREMLKYERPLVLPWSAIWRTDEVWRTARQTEFYLGGRSLNRLLSERDWKPTTASPESIRTWEYEPQGVGDFWGSPGVGLLFSY